MMKHLHVIMLFLAGMLGSAALNAETTPTNDANTQTAVIVNGVQQVNMLAGSFFYKPNQVTVKVNVPVELMIKKESGMIPHNFVIESPDAGVVVKEELSSDVKTIRFTPTAIGKIPFYCTHGTHRDRGMEGVIDVVK